ncbi:MAG: HEAT repeat domain-containing protein [Verrucomicrobia bacterium]|nr:HEAT repeat domain-containing protein [Verrucomicrobiota bacterium]
MKPASLIPACLGFAVGFLLLVNGCSRNPGARVNVQNQIAALQSSDTNVVEEACIALAMAGERSVPAVPDLIPLLKHKDSEVRRLAAYALGEIGPKAKAAYPALQEVYSADSSRKVQTQAGMSMGSIDPSNAPPVMPNIQ